MENEQKNKNQNQYVLMIVGMLIVSLLNSAIYYSIATWINFIIYGASLLLVAWFIPAGTWGQLDIFISTSTLIMNICILGLDQSFMRFFNEPPSPLDKRGLLGRTMDWFRVK